MDATLVDLITKLVSSLGFPIFVAVWLLLRTDKFLDKNTGAIDKLTTAIDRLEAAHTRPPGG